MNGVNEDVYISISQSEDILAQLSVVINKASGCPSRSLNFMILCCVNSTPA